MAEKSLVELHRPVLLANVPKSRGLLLQPELRGHPVFQDDACLTFKVQEKSACAAESRKEDSGLLHFEFKDLRWQNLIRD